MFTFGSVRNISIFVQRTLQNSSACHPLTIHASRNNLFDVCTSCYADAVCTAVGRTGFRIHMSAEHFTNFFVGSIYVCAPVACHANVLFPESQPPIGVLPGRCTTSYLCMAGWNTHKRRESITSVGSFLLSVARTSLISQQSI